jgi:hypothetical protein
MKNPFRSGFEKNFGSIALVGNGPSLYKSGYGEVIDDKNVVVRMNSAPVKGFEPDVGQRTNFRIVNNILINGTALSFWNTPENWIQSLQDQDLIVKPLDRDWDLSRKKEVEALGNRALTINEGFRQKLDEVKSYLDVRKLSTGLFAVLLFMNVSSELHLFGYDFYGTDKGHYWEKPKADPTGNHDFTVEKRFIKQLLEKYDFRIYN